jgi:dihydrofolate synthase/folylpolyglutamate synthase
LLQAEGLKVGTIYASHILSYSERIFVNNEPIPNKVLAEALNTVIDTSLKNGIQATAFELMVQTGLSIFAKEGISLGLLEVGIGGRLDATAIYTPRICAITKIAKKHLEQLGGDLDEVAYEMMGVAKPGSWLISAEQSKLRLQKMKSFAENKNFQWSMPIRKLSPLPYIYEQLFGKEASLAERIVQIYIENIKGSFSPFLRGNLLATQKGQRGRPTLETKRNSELNPLQTVKSFWAQHFKLNHGVFEILEQEKPTILLDKAEDVDSLAYTFLGLRLLHYKKPIVGLCLIVGLAKEIDAEEVLKLARYLFKKVPGEIYFIPLTGKESHQPENLCATAKTLNVRALAFQNIKEAFESAKTVVDERDGIVCLTGDAELVSSYWKQVREIKKLQL